MISLGAGPFTYQGNRRESIVLAPVALLDRSDRLADCEPYDIFKNPSKLEENAKIRNL
jgi:hypothetical protein